jgi:hypothetical protein
MSQRDQLSKTVRLINPSIPELSSLYLIPIAKSYLAGSLALGNIYLQQISK